MHLQHSSIGCHNGAHHHKHAERFLKRAPTKVDAQGGEKTRGGGPLTRIAPESVGPGGVVLVSMAVDSFLLVPPPTQHETFQKDAHECAAQDGLAWESRHLAGTEGDLHMGKEAGCMKRMAWQVAMLAFDRLQQEARCSTAFLLWSASMRGPLV